MEEHLLTLVAVLVLLILIIVLWNAFSRYSSSCKRECEEGAVNAYTWLPGKAKPKTFRQPRQKLEGYTAEQAAEAQAALATLPADPEGASQDFPDATGEQDHMSYVARVGVGDGVMKSHRKWQKDMLYTVGNAAKMSIVDDAKNLNSYVGLRRPEYKIRPTGGARTVPSEDSTQLSSGPQLRFASGKSAAAPSDYYSTDDNGFTKNDYEDQW
jgi:hypothetical protein